MRARLSPRALAGIALVAGCGGGAVKAAPPPLRPAPRAVQVQTIDERSDCEPVVPSDGPSPLTYEERSVEEAENLANQGSDLLQQSAPAEDHAQNEHLLEQAVHRFITALLADPYNVNATYNLAAAYARIGRAQCAVNLLARLVPMRKLPSLAPRVEEKLDRLLGRKDYRGRLDPDFFELRDDPRFRDLVKNF
ncbi:MAG TPA: hypothetical protein VK698_13545 [Kofleriaceae bacterium]|nr:hypothetical protein [Kofleriaceae bacterium]